MATATAKRPKATDTTGVSTRDLMLSVALEPTDEAVEHWRRLAREGASDGVIESGVRTILGEQGGTCCTTDEGPICWLLDLDMPPQVWFDFDAPPPRGKPHLTGKDLVASVRRIYQIEKPAGASNGKQRSATKAATNGQAVVSIDVPVAAISRFPLNPRGEEEFDEASLRDLGESLRERQVQACLVRRDCDGYELIAGERRWRAAKLVGLKTLRCDVVEATDAQAIRWCGEENEKRRDWSPIARARWYRSLKETLGLSVKELGEMVGVSAGQATSTMGLLDLPEDWQARIISQEISPTAARALIPWAKKRPQVLAALANENLTDITTVDMEEAIRAAINRCTRPTSPGYGANAPQFKLDKAALSELDVEELPAWGGGKEKRAWNVEAWDRRQKEAKKAAAAKAKIESKAGTAVATKSSSQNAAVPERNEVDFAGLERAIRWWQGQIVASRLTTRHKHLATRLLILAFEASPSAYESINGTVSRLAGTEGRRGPIDTRRTYAALAAIDDGKLTEVVIELVRDILRAEELDGYASESVHTEAGEALHAVGVAMGIDWLAEWIPDDSMLGCWSLLGLRKMPSAPQDLDTPATIKALLAEWPKGHIPTEVAKLLGGPKPAAKKKASAK